ncbi:MAG: hypothetical protein HY034_08965 [Nitrospirae bacterium]|nr:hypothetical protein [Nitrospirota bacterium]
MVEVMQNTEDRSRNSDIKIELSKGAEENGLANILFDLIRQNIERRPEKINDLQRLNTTVSLSANDIDVAVLLRFQNGQLIIDGNISEEPEIKIITDSETILDLSRIKIIGGLPYYFDETGRGIIKKLLSGRLKIRGLFAHLIKLTRLTRIMSVV